MSFLGAITIDYRESSRARECKSDEESTQWWLGPNVDYIKLNTLTPVQFGLDVWTFLFGLNQIVKCESSSGL